jgi:hypothetical protein
MSKHNFADADFDNLQHNFPEDYNHLLLCKKSREVKELTKLTVKLQEEINELKKED